MAKIGIINLDLHYLLDNTDNLKKDLLLFDEVEICDFTKSHEQFCKTLTQNDELFFRKKAEIDALQNAGLLRQCNEPKTIITGDVEKIRNALVQRLTLEKKSLETWEKFQERRDLVEMDVKGLFTDFIETDSKSTQFRARSLAVLKNLTSPQNEYIPLIRREFYPAIEEINTKVKVINLVISKLPTLDDSITLTQLCEIKSDKDFRLKYFAFKDFVNSLSTSSLSVNEIDEKIEFLLMDYEKQLKIHKAKYQLSRIEAIFVTTSEIVENLIKLKFGKLAKSIISFKNKEVELLEAESKLPGREVAILHDIKNNLKAK